MGVFLVAVSVDACGRDTKATQAVIEQHAGSAAALAVDEAHPRLGEVFNAVDAKGVAGRGQNALFPVHKAQQHRGLFQIIFNGLDVVHAGCWVEQVTARQMALPALEGHQAAQRTHMGRSKAKLRVRLAQHAVEQVKGVIVAADGQQGPGKGSGRAQQLNGNGFTRIAALAVARDSDNAIGPAEAGDGSGAARQGHGHNRVAHAAQLDPQPFFHAGP